jgi:predicted AlkP superfamily phosphohydrolase/phosphomutase
MNNLKRLYSPNGLKGDLDWKRRAGFTVEDALNWLETHIDIKTRVVVDKVLQNDWDYFHAHYSEAHDVGHHFWALHDSSHPEHDPVESERLGDPLLRIYQRMDRALGQICEAVGSDVTVMLYTSTGMEANYSGNGLLDYYLSRLDKAEVNEFRDRTCFELRNHPGAGAIRFNLLGRESKGRISESGYDDYCANLAGELLNLTDIDTGRHVVKYVVKCRERFPGPRVDQLPDLMVLWDREAPISGFVSSVGTMDFGDFRPGWTGDHSSNAVLMIRNPDGDPSKTSGSIRRFEEYPGFIANFLNVDVDPGDQYPLTGMDAGRIDRARHTE